MHLILRCVLFRAKVRVRNLRGRQKLIHPNKEYFKVIFEVITINTKKSMMDKISKFKIGQNRYSWFFLLPQLQYGSAQACSWSCLYLKFWYFVCHGLFCINVDYQRYCIKISLVSITVFQGPWNCVFEVNASQHIPDWALVHFLLYPQCLAPCLRCGRCSEMPENARILKK